MRDILTVMLFSGGAILALRHPYIGVLLWTWVSVMNPHRLGWGFAYSLPLAAVAAVITMIAMTYGKPRPRFPLNGPTIFLILFFVWMGISTIFAIHVDDSFEIFVKVFKTLLMTLIAISIIQEKKHVDAMLWVIVGSLCFFGVKGGLFTLLTGGSFRVWGPPDSLIEGNNELAIALVMTVPLLYYLGLGIGHKWGKRAIYSAMGLCSIAAIGSQSRGALLAIIAMSTALTWKSKHKLKIFLVVVMLSPAFLAMMPDTWWERMSTIRTYQEDDSAMGRITAWHLAWNAAIDRITGVGFETTTREIYLRYSPEPNGLLLVAHSIYFQVLGQHGFPGLFLYLMMWLTTYRMAGRLKKHVTSLAAEDQWIADLGRMMQVSLIGFFVGGAFLSLAYWDVPYYLLVILVAVDQLAKKSSITTSASNKKYPKTPPFEPDRKRI